MSEEEEVVVLSLSERCDSWMKKRGRETDRL